MSPEILPARAVYSSGQAWRGYLTRKDKIERIIEKYGDLQPDQAALAWFSLQTLMIEMTHPEAHSPKFDDFLFAVLRSGIRAKYWTNRL